MTPPEELETVEGSDETHVPPSPYEKCRADLKEALTQLREEAGLLPGEFRLLLREALHREIVREAREQDDAEKSGHGEPDDPSRQS